MFQIHITSKNIGVNYPKGKSTDFCSSSLRRVPISLALSLTEFILFKIQLLEKEGKLYHASI